MKLERVPRSSDEYGVPSKSRFFLRGNVGLVIDEKFGFKGFHIRNVTTRVLYEVLFIRDLCMCKRNRKSLECYVES